MCQGKVNTSVSVCVKGHWTSLSVNVQRTVNSSVSVRVKGK